MKGQSVPPAWGKELARRVQDMGAVLPNALSQPQLCVWSAHSAPGLTLEGGAPSSVSFLQVSSLGTFCRARVTAEREAVVIKGDGGLVQVSNPLTKRLFQWDAACWPS